MEETKLNHNKKAMLRKRGFNPDDYVLVKQTYASLIVRNIRTGQIRLINKQN